MQSYAINRRVLEHVWSMKNLVVPLVLATMDTSIIAKINIMVYILFLYMPLVHIRKFGPLLILPVCCAEFNAIVSAYRYHADLTSATLYTTGVPCSYCAIKIIQSGIKTVVFGRIRGTQRQDGKKQNDEVGANEQKDDVPPEADEKEDENETVQQNEAGANKEEEKKDGEMPVPQEPEADVQQNKAGANEEDEDVMEEEAKKIFYWGKVATM